MNEIVMWLGLEAWKPLLGALMLPPVPAMLLVVVGGLRCRRWWGPGLLALGVLGLWLGSCIAVAEPMKRWLLSPPPAVDPATLRALPAAKATIVVLGGGRETFAPEYVAANLDRYSLERLRYGVWLSRASGLDVGFSGGIGHAGVKGVSEARIAADIAAREFQHPLRWMEEASRDTRENAARSVALLRAQGVTTIVVVTHEWHMPRAQRAFEQAVAAAGMTARVIPAPMALADNDSLPVLRWLPSGEGFTLLRQVVRERIGLLMGA